MQWNEFCSQLRPLSSDEMTLLKKAFELGDTAHAGQMRASGEPYFTHPVAVALVLSKMNADIPTIIAALLHDTIEDTPVTLDQIQDAFGPVVANLVDGVTKLNEGDVAVRPSLDQKIETLRKMFTLMEKDVRIMIIKLADRLHNMQTIGFRSPEKQRAVAQETLDIYVKVADRLCMRDMRDKLEILCIQVMDPESINQLLQVRQENMMIAENVIKYMKKQIESQFGQLNFEMLFELKSIDNLRVQYEMEKDGGAGLAAINIACVCNDTNACYQVLGMLHRIWPREILTFEDYINVPVINGYKALHTNVILEDGKRIRCKIRTREMQEYAHYGVSLMAFGKEGTSNHQMNTLPWTQRISPLAKDTRDRSKEFWNSLQNDILGESIIIHGEGDQTALLPKGATALDGVFYLYGKKALNTTHIRINGKEVPFYELLAYANTVQATFGEPQQSELRWLQYVHTGIATALIREGLTEEVQDKKILTGKMLLQNYLNEQRRGYLQEIDTNHLQEIIRQHGYESLEDVYIHIAEGRMLPQEIDQVLFYAIESDKASAKKRQWYTVKATLMFNQRRTFFDAMHMYEMKNLHVYREKNGSYKYRCNLFLSDEEHAQITLALERTLAGSFSVNKESAVLKATAASIALFLLWGLDPVVARILLHTYSVTPVDLTIVRFLSLSILSGAFFAWIRSRRILPEKRLSLANTSLWLSVIFLFLISLTTYYSLQQTYPSHYTIPMTAAGLFLTSIVNKHRKWMLLAMWSLIAIGFAILILHTTQWPLSSIGMTVLAIISFTGFSYVSEKYKRQEEVSLRLAQYFFILSVLCTLLSLALLPFATIHHISPQVLLGIIGFSMFISGVPYYIYYQLLSHKEIDFVLRYSFLIIPCTLLSQELFIRVPSVWTLLSGAIVMLGAMLPVIDFPQRIRKK